MEIDIPMKPEDDKLVILVDNEDRNIGSMSKREAHLGKGKLHRCFSVFLFDDDGNVILQKRADEKYHSGGLITNTCCSHPTPKQDSEEALLEAVKERLQYEMNIDCDDISKLMTFRYRKEFPYNSFYDDTVTEHEYDHTFIGTHNGPLPEPNHDEVAESFKKPVQKVLDDIEKNPDDYTAWFRLAFAKVLELKNSPQEKIPHFEFE